MLTSPDTSQMPAEFSEWINNSKTDTTPAVLTHLIRISSSDTNFASWFATSSHFSRIFDACNPAAESTVSASDTSKSSPSQQHTSQSLLSIFLSKFFHDLNDATLQQVRSRLTSTVTDWIQSPIECAKEKGLISLKVLFQSSLDIGKSILCQDGILDDLLDTVEFDSEKLQLLVLQVLAEASSEKGCRAVIALKCQPFVKRYMRSEEEAFKNAATVTMSKLMIEEPSTSASKSSIELLDNVVGNVKDSKAPTLVRISAVESLAYLSIQPQIKARLIEDTDFLKSLFSLAKPSSNTPVEQPLRYGIATILQNLTAFKPKLSAEQEQIRKLRQFANANSAPSNDNPLNSDSAVTSRCITLVKLGAGVVLNYLIQSPQSTSSQTLRESIANVYLSLATEPSNRPHLVQQGAIKPLLSLSTDSPSNNPQCIFSSSHALAKIAITMNPHIAFPKSAIDFVKPLVTLLDSDSSLAVFESLLALTNLGSMSYELCDRILDCKGLQKFENLMFDENELIRRSAIEVMCNLLRHEIVYEKYAEIKSIEKIKVFIAYTDVEDHLMRRASSGFIAMLSSCENFCKVLGESDWALKILKKLVTEEENLEVVYRGVEIWKNLTTICGLKVGEKMKEIGVLGGLKRVMTMCVDMKHEDISQVVMKGALETLKTVKDCGVDM
ncbi:armadillo-type protein [Paraphysoderma sedebokerense]|nr:armadillo-type protein [Paraphysoderma sedebokerense]KAI9139058.1 armadillo-type protein [Paraphysoderma sedebokerense]